MWNAFLAAANCDVYLLGTRIFFVLLKLQLSKFMKIHPPNPSLMLREFLQAFGIQYNGCRVSYQLSEYGNLF